MDLSSAVSPLFWVGFIAFVLAMLAIDLFVLGGRKAHRVSAREALAWTGVWVTLSLSFCALLWWWLDGTAGREVANAKALEFLTGYLIELSLSVDNIFVFIMIFTFFAVPAEYQRRVLIYGVLGAIVMRASMILAGAWLVQQFHWILYLFGAFLVITGIKMLIFAEAESNLADNPVLKWMRGHLRITQEYHGEKFTVMKDGVRWFTPLFLVLVLIETSDLVFAVDSIPAIFAVTTDPFIVFTSNIFAIMGLRSMYFLLADLNDRFHLLKYGLAMVLVFVGSKMLIVDFYKIPIGLALGIVALILTSSVVASLAATRKRHA
ncbi:MAG: TerC family integral membrane protein [bacterium]|jgi:tellurite resistance protein TerC|nr:MAG: TerC family integral membrane protein [bacterium]KAF0150020.1 MAG: TerC family integral membrane protein [bacterium]KAF0169128.1 MAG: TerC family integral membrane protein [bacterium]TXT21465.1 MAG: TerC family integral membrane protein [bacterium]